MLLLWNDFAAFLQKHVGRKEPSSPPLGSLCLSLIAKAATRKLLWQNVLSEPYSHLKSEKAASAEK